MKNYSFLWLLLFILIAEGAGFLGLFFIGSVDGWYTTLSKAALTPPSWLFGPVWAILYALIGSAAYLVWRQKSDGNVLRLYWIQLAANTVWTPLFFGLQNPELALIDIAILFVLIVLTIVAFGRIHKLAGILLIPYLLWVGFATYLNVMVVLLN